MFSLPTKFSLSDTIDQSDAMLPLAIQTFMTGFVNILVYNQSQTWIGFQTGNMVQFSGNIAEYIFPHSTHHPLLTVLRIVSIVSFTVGSLSGARIGDWLNGHRKRGWLAASSLIQSIFLWIAAGILLGHSASWDPGLHAWPPIIMLCALSMGFQSVLAQKMSSPHFATTVAFTATLTQMASEKNLIRGFILSKRPLAIVALALGAGIGQTCLLHPKFSFRGGITLAAGIKLLQMFCWLITPAKREET